MKSFQGRIGSWVIVAALAGFGSAMAQTEPTLDQVYEAAKSGQLDKAQTMMQQVLVAHPNSAKAHYVQAELSARAGNLSRAREELANAEKLAPGLSFAKPDAVQHLRNQLAGKSSVSANANANALSVAPAAVAPAPPASSFPWGLALALGGAAIGLGIYLTRKKAAPPLAPATAYGNGLSGPQTFGMGNASPNAPYGQPPYGQAPYGQPAASSGLGSRVAGGLATGLAVGAGMMAANAIGKTLMGDGEHGSRAADQGASGNGWDAAPQNADMGGQDFGIQDGGSWDDGGGGASGDWDN